MKYFMMSVRYNKQTPADFGLKLIDGKFIHTKDGTEWEPCELYDFGWGKEIGFYKKPLGSFTELIRLVVRSSDDEDSFGATAIIEELFLDELKKYLLDSTRTAISFAKRKRINDMFHLHLIASKAICKNVSIDQKNKEENDWKVIIDFYSSKT